MVSGGDVPHMEPLTAQLNMDLAFQQEDVHAHKGDAEDNRFT